MLSDLKTTLTAICIGVLLISCADKQEQSKEEGAKPAADSLVEKAQQTPLDISAIQKELDVTGEEKDGGYKVSIPQNDLKVMVDGFQIIPPMGLGSWVAFSPSGSGAMIMGDIVLTEKDLWPVQQEVIKQGLSITAIHNHFVRMDPDIWYMHIGGTGRDAELASGVKAIFDKVKEVRGGHPGDAPKSEVKNTLDTTMISDILGYSGNLNRGVYKVVIGRPEVKLTSHGTPVDTFMGFNTWTSWQGSDDRASVAGDFAMLENEVEPVIKALVENGIEVVAVHNHRIHEDPRIFFLHFWGVGKSEQLAKGLRKALDQTGSK